MKFSVITVCKNSEKTIENAVNCVISQSFKDFEYIIIDGNSDDNTMKLIDKYRNKITEVISEPDSGLYDAMNKGIKAASGDYLFFLNSDDTFLHDNILELLAEQINNSTETAELIYGDIAVLNKKTGKLSIQKHNKFNKIYLMKNTPCQPGTFYKREVFEKYGDFDTNYKIVSDHEWFLRVFLKHGLYENLSRIKYIGFPITVFNTGGLSTDKSREAKLSAERNDMLDKYFTKKERKSYEFLSKYLRTFTTFPYIKKFF